MHEMLLQFIWQYSLYQPNNLHTTDGEPVTVIFPGTRNKNAGPDFLEGKIKIGNTILVGNIELHVHSGDWYAHKHQDDKAYHNIILHVVYKNEGRKMPNVPTLELAPAIPHYVINQYTYLIQTQQQVPCGNELAKISSIVKESWLNRMLAERWELKLADWQTLLNQAAGDWRNLLYWRMAANFGFKINAEPFLMLAQSISLNVLAKHRENLLQVEALLFGQAGFLEGTFKDEYPLALQKEYQYLQQKYNLKPLPAHLWKFLRLRPANFPTIRIAQFAALINRSVHLFSKILERTSFEEVNDLLDVKASEYWEQHFRFEEPQNKATKKKLGKTSVENIIINTVAPIQFLYAHHHGQQEQQEQAVQLLESIHAEQNNILRVWDSYDWKPVNAAQSQAMIQLYNNYCTPKRCLECSIGLSILRSAPAK